jgi:hypothetical protein
MVLFNFILILCTIWWKNLNVTLETLINKSTTKQNVVFGRSIIEEDFAIEHVSLNLLNFAFN